MSPHEDGRDLSQDPTPGALRSMLAEVDFRDVLAVGGVALVAVGVGLVWTLGAGLIAFGAGVFYMGALHGVVWLRSLPRRSE